MCGTTRATRAHVHTFPHTSQVPPLRVRPGDVRDYSRHILAGIKNGSGTRPRDLSLDAAKRLESYTWPGNVTVRERETTGELHLARDRHSRGGGGPSRGGPITFHYSTDQYFFGKAGEFVTLASIPHTSAHPRPA